MHWGFGALECSNYRIARNIGGFKFGGSVRDRHMYICEQEILVDFNLAVVI